VVAGAGVSLHRENGLQKPRLCTEREGRNLTGLKTSADFTKTSQKIDDQWVMGGRVAYNHGDKTKKKGGTGKEKRWSTQFVTSYWRALWEGRTKGVGEQKGLPQIGNKQRISKRVRVNGNLGDPP